MSNNIIIYIDFSGKLLQYLLISVKRYINYIFIEIFYYFQLKNRYLLFYYSVSFIIFAGKK